MRKIIPVICEVAHVLWAMIAATFETVILGKKPEAQEPHL